MKRFLKLLVSQAFLLVIGPKMFYQSIFVLRFISTTIANFLPALLSSRRRVTSDEDEIESADESRSNIQQAGTLQNY